MKQPSRIHTFLFLLFLSSGIGGRLTADTKEACLNYAPAKSTVVGTLSHKVFPGPPNYESIKGGDKAEKTWVLHLHHPLCVQGDPKNPLNEETESKVTDLQLVLTAEKYASFKDLMSRNIRATGQLFHAQTGHHHTPVLLDVESLEPNVPGTP
jgi:hypothetical protein